MSRIITRRSSRALALISAVIVLVLLAFTVPASGAREVAVRELFGNRVALGNGNVRTYVTMKDGVPVELGVALTEAALKGLPHHGPDAVKMPDGHATFEHLLPMPAENPTPFRTAVLNWNPGGHEPPGIYDTEHFDVHFFFIDNPSRLAIDPSDPQFQQKAERLPAADLVPKGFFLPAPLAFARMGVHWVDRSAPELNGKPFTATFIYGSYDGKMTFAEPMLTKAFLESKPQFSAPLPVPARVERPGYYPGGYSVRWDEPTKEYRIALTRFVKHD